MRQLCTAVIVPIFFAVSLHAAPPDSEKIGQDELVRRTQELFDAVAIGDQRPWKQHFAEDAMYFDEKGRSMDKSALVADITRCREGTRAPSRWRRCKAAFWGGQPS